MKAKEEQKSMIGREEILEEIKLALKEVFVATVRNAGDELEIRFPNGQTFLLRVWESL